jgi:hypothetical protein
MGSSTSTYPCQKQPHLDQIYLSGMPITSKAIYGMAKTYRRVCGGRTLGKDANGLSNLNFEKELGLQSNVLLSSRYFSATAILSAHIPESARLAILKLLDPRSVGHASRLPVFTKVLASLRASLAMLPDGFFFHCSSNHIWMKNDNLSWRNYIRVA